MKKRNFIFGGLAGMMFVVFVTLNITVSKSYHKNISSSKLTLVDLTVLAQNADECWVVNDCISGKCLVEKVTTEKSYWFGINMENCETICTPGGIYCCPGLDKWCYPAE